MAGKIGNGKLNFWYTPRMSGLADSFDLMFWCESISLYCLITGDTIRQ